MKKKIVLAGGCFDILHFGHIHYLKNAKALGDHLVVAIESDANIKKLKGEKRPFHNQNQRKEILESLSFVNEVIILKDKMSDSDYEELVLSVYPHVVAVTQGDPILEKKKNHATKVNAKVVEIPKVSVSSTSEIAKILELEV